MLPPVVIIAGGAMLGVASGYVIDKVIGDGNYNRQELVTDGVLGAIPGVGWAAIGGRFMLRMRHLRHFDRTVDVVTDIPYYVLLANRSEVRPIIKTVVASVLVGTGVNAVLNSSGSYQQNVMMDSVGTDIIQKKKPKGKRFVKKPPKYCRIHRKYDYCYNQ